MMSKDTDSKEQQYLGLVVEDDTIAREFVKDYLSENAELQFASTGKAAIELFTQAFEQRPFDLVCLDIGLPDMAGPVVLEQMRKIEAAKRKRDKKIVIVMTTAASDIRTVLKAMNAGCNGYVVKPFTKDQLMEELRKGGLEVHWQRALPEVF